MSDNAHELTKRLLNALDSNYNVLDMVAVNDIISILENIQITKELLETTRLGKHVNEVRRRSRDPVLARRAKLLVKRWRDAVMPAAAPAATAHAPAPRLPPPAPAPPAPSAAPGYESDQDVIVVDEEPPRDVRPTTHKKLKRKRGHSRAGSGAESARGCPAEWGSRNGASQPPGSPALTQAAPAPVALCPAPAPGALAPAPRRNGCRRPHNDPYADLMQKLPKAGHKKVKTTAELLEQIQSRGAPGTPGLPARAPPLITLDDDDDEPPPPPVPPPSETRKEDPVADVKPEVDTKLSWYNDEGEGQARGECTCGEVGEGGEVGEEEAGRCPAAARAAPGPHHVRALHHAYIPGVNGTRALRPPPDPNPSRPLRHALYPDLFYSVVPLYKYLDYTNDHCVKNLSQLPPPPADPPPPSGALLPEPRAPDHHIRPPLDPDLSNERLADVEDTGYCENSSDVVKFKLGDSDALDSVVSEKNNEGSEVKERSEIDGKQVWDACSRAMEACRYRYGQAGPAPVLRWGDVGEDIDQRLRESWEGCDRDELGRPVREERFAEWHEPAALTPALTALPYVLID